MADLYETYLRDNEGRTWHPDNFREGIEQFLSEDGYRISFDIDGVVLTLRRDSEVKPIETLMHEREINCNVRIR